MNDTPDRNACKAPAEKARQEATAQGDAVEEMEERLAEAKALHEAKLSTAEKAEAHAQDYETLWERREQRKLDVDDLKERLEEATEAVEETTKMLWEMKSEANDAVLPRSRASSVGSEDDEEPGDAGDVAQREDTGDDEESEHSEDDQEPEDTGVRPVRSQERRRTLGAEQEPQTPVKAVRKTAQSTPMNRHFPQPLPNMAPNIFKINGQYEALSCSVAGCGTNQHRGNLKLFKDFKALKRHAREAHGEQYKVDFPEKHVSDREYLNSQYVERIPVSADEIAQIRSSGTLPEHLEVRPPLNEEYQYPVPAKRKRRDGSVGQSGSRKKPAGNARQVLAGAPAIDEEYEDEQLGVMNYSGYERTPQNDSSVEKIYAPPSHTGLSLNTPRR